MRQLLCASLQCSGENRLLLKNSLKDIYPSQGVLYDVLYGVLYSVLSPP